jgi:hypothetical protein
MNARQLHHQPVSAFLVTNCVSDKTLGAVYAVSIQSAKEIANTLWVKDKHALLLFDLHGDHAKSNNNTSASCASLSATMPSFT